MAEKQYKIEIRDEEITLSPDRSLHWHRTDTLVVADLHWGKSEVFQSRGLLLPSAVLAADLERLRLRVLHQRARRLLILGDLIHAKSGLTTQVIEDVTHWRRRLDCAIVVVRGNHDRIKTLPDSWDMQMVESELVEAPFLFSHFPDPSPRGFVWGGHIHPVLWVLGGGDALRLPCFYVDEHVGVLPSFGTATGGSEIHMRPGCRSFVIAGDEVIEWSP